MFEEKQQIINERQRLFIRRERVRRELLKINPGETICLNFEQISLVLRWVKELENENKALKERAGKYGFQKS